MSNFNELENLYNKKRYNDLEIKTKKLIKNNPNIATLHNILGMALKEQNKHNEAIESFRKCILKDKKYFLAYNNLANILVLQNKHEDALKYYNLTLKINPKYSEAHYNKGNLHRDKLRYGEAIKSYNTAINLEPKHFKSYNNLGFVLRRFGKIKEALNCFEKAIEIKPDFIKAYNNFLFNSQYLDHNNFNQILKKCKSFKKEIKKIDKKKIEPFSYLKNPNKLKVGFVSSDFRNHPIGYFLIDWIKHTNKQHIEYYAFSNNSVNDDLTIELKNHFIDWYNIEKKIDEEVVSEIRKKGIHILIDLSGHTSGNRLPIFINKSAPIQIAWAGFLATTGIDEIDYILGDPYVTPIKNQSEFIEKIFMLPDIWCCFSIPNYKIEIKNPPFLKNNFITFGSFNNISKINEETIRVWSKILKSLQKSKILLKTPELDNIEIKEEILKKFKENNINLNKIILEGGSSRDKLLESYNKIDIALDSFPYSGGTTSFEAVWMGVPIITKEGKKFVSRSTGSININLGMQEWIASSNDEYIRKAISFASKTNELLNIKKNLREKSVLSPIFNHKLFAKNFEATMWKIWKQGK